MHYVKIITVLKKMLISWSRLPEKLKHSITILLAQSDLE